MEDLVAQIDAPPLDDLRIRLFHQDTFNTPQLTQFVDRTPNYKPRVNLFGSCDVRLPQTFDGALELGISHRWSEW